MPNRHHDTRLLRMLLVNAGLGAIVAAVFLAAVLILDIASLGSLISGAETPLLVIGILYSGLLITFSSCAMGAAIMSLPEDEQSSSAGGGHLQPIRVTASRHRHPLR